jgi:predicted RND superfamily exporter protein
MSRFSLVEFSIARPGWVLLATALLTLLFLTQFPKIVTDTNPKHMLPSNSDVRVWNDQVDRSFALYEDTIVVGIENPAGVLNRDTLGRIARLTDYILGLEGVASRDVNGFTTITNVTAADGVLNVGPLMPAAPSSDADVAALEKALFGNPLFIDRIISRDGRTTAIYVPLEKGANGAEIAARIRAAVAKETGPERYYIAGDPVARDTFGAEMFRLMALFSPVAGMIMFAAMQIMFRNLALSAAMMGVSMAAIVWSMGLLIGIGFPVHIMSSMAPVFLMAIATDSIHIFNEFHFRYHESGDRRAAIRATMAAINRPVRFTALATTAGFAVLLFMNIVPVRVFGGLIAFGTVMLRLLSFSFIPAVLSFVGEERLRRTAGTADVAADPVARLLGRIGAHGARRPRLTVVIVAVVAAVSAWGAAQIHVNNNLVAWFKPGSEIRVADDAINRALGGTSLGYLVVGGADEDFVKRPETMRWLEGMQRHLETLPVVGKTFSVADYVKRINRVLHDDDPQFDRVPDNAETIGQYLFLFSMSAKAADLDNVADPLFRQANLWVQMKTWDADAMRQVIAAAQAYQRNHPLTAELKPAGIAYFNLVWNDEVLGDLVLGFSIALAAVLIILALDFRSLKWALVAYLPLLLTILAIYGVVGFAGKDFDMPLSVMSTLSLGMAVDFAIHFVSRFRQRRAEAGVAETPAESLAWTAARPGKGIMRNALLFAAAFSVMMAAPLTPYVAVGAFIVSMMLISALLTLWLLPALIMLARRFLIEET